MMRRDFENALRLHDVNTNCVVNRKDLELKGYYYNDKYLGKSSSNVNDKYYIVLKDYINWNLVEQVLRGLKYIDCGIGYMSRIDTKEGYTVINSVTKDEYENLKNIDKKYFGIEPNLSDRDLTLEQYQTLNKMYGFVIPLIYNRAEEYMPVEYNAMVDRCYA